MLPSASVAPCGTCSGSPVAVPGMFQTSQCSWSSVVPFDATSGSCISSTKLAVPAGALVHFSSGDICSPACVYLAGISVPSAHPLVVNVMGGAAGAPPRAGGFCAAPVAAANIIPRVITFIFIALIGPVLQFFIESSSRLPSKPLERFAADLGRHRMATVEFTICHVVSKRFQ